MTLSHIVCHSCATRFHGTPEERPHEVLTESATEARLFRLAHAGHAGVRELSVDA